MRPHVILRVDDGNEFELGHGDFIGRLPTAALAIDDARISEAHAMVSLRAGRLVLLSLRRRIRVDQRPVDQVELRPKLRLELVEGLGLIVDRVVLPPHVLGVRIDREAPVALNGVSSVVAGTPPRLVTGLLAGALAHLWCTDGRWRMRAGDAPVRPVAPGDETSLAGVRLHFVEIATRDLTTLPTEAAGRSVTEDSVEIRARYDNVLLGPPHAAPTLRLTGVPARIVSELVSFGQPVYWYVLAREIWPDEDDRMTLRRRWDINLARLRRKLRDGGIRDSLVCADGLGNFELARQPGDQFHDES